MFEWMEILRIALKVLFWGILPAVIFYYRYKQRLTTGFAIGSVLTCLIFGLVSVATVKEDPIENFMTAVNLKKYEEAKKGYKVLIQGGPELLKKVNEKDIIDGLFFDKIKKDIVAEYYEIAERYSRTVTVNKIESCDKKLTEEYNMHKLNHALLLLDYARSIGTDYKDLKNILKEKVAVSEKVIAENTKLCD